MNSIVAPETAVHAPDCSIWDTPADARPDALIAEGIRQDELIAYCGAVRPVYDGFKRVLGQLSGILLLAQTGADTPDSRGPLLDVAGNQLREAADRLPGDEYRRISIIDVITL